MMRKDDVTAHNAPIGQKADVEKWRPIETAPTDGTQILVYAKGLPLNIQQPGIFEAWWIERNQYWATSNSKVHPTHWMPLPPLPSSNAR